jgi:hypothetical protein
MKSFHFCFTLVGLAAATAHGQPIPIDAEIRPPAVSPTTPVTPTPVAVIVPPPAVLPPTGAAEQPATTGETSIKLDVGFGIRAVLPSRVTVPPGERLTIVAPNLGENISYTWTKNGRAIPDTTGSTLTINHVVSSDAGTYVCQFSNPGQSSQILVLGVGPTDRLLNLSTRATIGGGADQGFVSGFTVEAGAQPKKLILRAVGPSLSMFGVTNPVAVPILRIFDSRGQPYTNGYVYPAVVGGPTYESDLADSLAKTGAFPIPAGTRDAVVMMPFVPGAYTAQVTSGDGTSGVVLLEIYEVP